MDNPKSETIMPDDSEELQPEKLRWFAKLTPSQRVGIVLRFMEGMPQRSPAFWERARHRAPTHTTNYQILEMRDSKPHVTYGPGSPSAPTC